MYVQNKVIISCAVTGAIHTPSMSPYLPVTPEEIAEASIAAAQAGAGPVRMRLSTMMPERIKVDAAAMMPSVFNEFDIFPTKSLPD